ncbi:unnamed protein product [Didymodactylos carnosus]|uniref:Peptidase C1A papain C-terminal domain-containing protein n=1 Tax=Didymodactylos carnosus TaxID=1234261 RepID=A0A814IIE2_9BILA|nr:unnamed protein product [Didymodactylos carnosus]CAF3795179.1 unnamed protein product [Didymodactylos carnosus]
MVGRVSLDMYINAANSSFRVKIQSGGTCYAHAVVTVFYLATRRIEDRENGVSGFADICQQLINAYGEEGAITENVLNIWPPKYRLHYEKVNELDSRQAINQRRPVNCPQGVLKSKDLGRAGLGAKLSGHAVVLMKCDPISLTFINSWGTEFADKDGLKPSEIRAFQRKSSETGRNLIEKLPPGIQNIPYEYPHCRRCSAVRTFIIHFSDAECPTCNRYFKPTPLGLNVTAYTY